MLNANFKFYKHVTCTGHVDEVYSHKTVSPLLLLLLSSSLLSHSNFQTKSDVVVDYKYLYRQNFFEFFSIDFVVEL